MKITEKHPPRVYECGFEVKRAIKDCGSVLLEPDEQLTFLTEDGGEYDLTRKSWGFYATPSLNGRLARFGLRGVLAKNRLGRLFVLLVERGKEPLFNAYLAEEAMTVVHWLDDDAACAALEAKCHDR